MEDIYKFMKFVMDLKKVKRQGWVVRNVKYPESTASHSYSTAMLAMILAKKLNVDENKLIKMALIHDLGESIVGDIIVEKGGTVISSKKEKYEKEKQALKEIFSKLEDGKEYYDLWIEFEEQVTDEAIIVMQLDKLDTLLQANEYRITYENSEFDEFWEYTKKYLKNNELTELYDIIEKTYKKTITS